MRGLDLNIASQSSQQGVMVWGFVFFDKRIFRIVISGAMTVQIYDDDIPESVNLPFSLRHPGFTFLHDNAR